MNSVFFPNFIALDSPLHSSWDDEADCFRLLQWVLLIAHLLSFVAGLRLCRWEERTQRHLLMRSRKSRLFCVHYSFIIFLSFYFLNFFFLKYTQTTFGKGYWYQWIEKYESAIFTRVCSWTPQNQLTRFKTVFFFLFLRHFGFMIEITQSSSSSQIDPGVKPYHAHPGDRPSLSTISN